MNVENGVNKQAFTAEIEREEGLVVLKLRGDLDVNGSQNLKSIFSTNIMESDRFIALEMTEVPYINSTGLAAIISFHKTIELRDGRLFIVNPQFKVRNVFQIASLEDRMFFVEDIEAARKMTLPDSQL